MEDKLIIFTLVLSNDGKINTAASGLNNKDDMRILLKAFSMVQDKIIEQMTSEVQQTEEKE